MANVEVNGTRLYYVESGAGTPVVFSHSYLVDHWQFDRQVEDLSDRYRVIAFDHRDYGRSARAHGPYELAILVDDAAALIQAIGAVPCHWLGLSTGGFVGMRLALREPGLFRSLTLMDTSGGSEPWSGRVRGKIMLGVARRLGIGPVLGPTVRLMFRDTFLQDPATRDEMQLWRDRIAAGDPDALTRFGNAIFGRDEVLGALGALEMPTMVVAGEQDRALPTQNARALAAAIPNARLEVIPRAGHLCTIEQADAVTTLLDSFFTSVGG